MYRVKNGVKEFTLVHVVNAIRIFFQFKSTKTMNRNNFIKKKFRFRGTCSGCPSGDFVHEEKHLSSSLQLMSKFSTKEVTN